MRTPPTLLNNVKALSLLNRKILYACAFLNDRFDISELSSQLGPNFFESRNSVYELDRCFRSLLAEGFLERDKKNKSYMRLIPEIRFDLIFQAFQENKYDELINLLTNPTVQSRYTMGWYRTTIERESAQFLWALLKGNNVNIKGVLSRVRQYASMEMFEKELASLWDNYLKGNLFFKLNQQSQFWVITHFTQKHIDKLEPLDELREYIQQVIAKGNPIPEFHFLLAEIFLLQGNTEGFLTALKDKNQFAEAQSLQYAHALFKGNGQGVIEGMNNALKQYRKEPDQKGEYFRTLGGLVFLMALLQKRDSASLKQFWTMSKAAAKFNKWAACLSGLSMIAAKQEGDVIRHGAHKSDFYGIAKQPFSYLWRYLTLSWADDDLSNDTVELMYGYALNARKSGYKWLELELLAALSSIDTQYLPEYQALSGKIGYQSIFGVREKLAPWQKSLDALRIMAERSDAENKMTRLVWYVDFEKLDISPREQTRSPKGWNAGKAVALKRLHEGAVDSMTTQDRAVMGALRTQGYYNSLTLDPLVAFPALVGHPLLLLEKSGASVELIRDTVSLIIDKRKDGSFEVALSIPVTQTGFVIEKETPTRYKLYEIDETHVRISQQLGTKKLVIPAEGEKLLGEIAGKLTGVVQVQSELNADMSKLPRVEADDTLRLHILPQGDGFRLEALVKPFKTDPPYFKPGEGRDNIMAEVGGVRMLAVRNLNKEGQNLKDVLQASATLRLDSDGTHEWEYDEPEDCLQILLDLEPLTDKVIIEWPEGQKLKIASRVSMDQLSIRVNKGKDWFEASGELKMDSGQVMSLLEAMRLLDSGPGRFIELSTGEYLVLTSEFRKRLDEMKAWSDQSKGTVRIHALAAPAWEEAASEAAQFIADKSWKERISRLKDARKLQAVVPPDFQADMRPYQEDGFRWMAQLAHWGVGACLADDMGLGKTIQALALLLYRAKQGPSLVVAPPTVARNWISEIQKFTPGLNAILYVGKDRENLLQELGANDLVITSYGLLQSDIELLAVREWNVVVLDEAQSIKNFQAKRSQAAMELQAGFKMITTGTPIENHLGELWNLFQFINPGLLGSLKFFNERYAIPIEKNRDTARRQQLQKLIQPFILRRRKNQVLKELPEKTEITLSVELSPQEAALYEAMRISAVERLSSLKGKGGEKQLQIFAEIMKLRRLCCDPKLVNAQTKVEGSKMAVLAEIVEELREGGHKALIFSQFVGFLEIVRAWVEKEKISYQYLDGSTSQKQREIAIREFQGGKGDLFLISLKAGGVGLNLTAADYVIHLDPWWNPAVEDQASDRAHRIGQEMPVTIYRLVTKGTIEEKIVQLHTDKRDLADSLLEGTDSSGKLSADALLKMLSEV